VYTTGCSNDYDRPIVSKVFNGIADVLTVERNLLEILDTTDSSEDMLNRRHKLKSFQIALATKKLQDTDLTNVYLAGFAFVSGTGASSSVVGVSALVCLDASSSICILENFSLQIHAEYWSQLMWTSQ
jgi:hypothetical protein